MEEVREDFDRIAVLTGEGWDHNGHYHEFLLRQVPDRCGDALDVGCGSGAFARRLAGRAERVLALDLSPGMIELAQERSAQFPNITFSMADATTYPLPPAQFDCVATIATLHHLPLREALGRLEQTLRPGGVLLVLDLYRADGLADNVWGALAIAPSLALQLIHTGRLRESAAVRAAWAEHGRHDVYPTLTEVRQVCAETLPGAQVRRHLLWRYSIVWQKHA